MLQAVDRRASSLDRHNDPDPCRQSGQTPWRLTRFPTLDSLRPLEILPWRIPLPPSELFLPGTNVLYGGAFARPDSPAESAPESPATHDLSHHRSLTPHPITNAKKVYWHEHTQSELENLLP